MSELAQKKHEDLPPQPLDRLQLAIMLRQAGVDVDFEDWDGLTDDDVRSRTIDLVQENPDEI